MGRYGVLFCLGHYQPNSLAALQPPERTLELGFKDLGGTDGCNKHDFGSSGFSSGVEAEWDYTEDAEDAVVWISGMDELVQDTLYTTWGRCHGSSAGYWYNSPGPVLEAQLGEWNEIQEPATTYSEATMRYMPGETAYRAFPDASEFRSTDSFNTLSHVAWNRNSNFEEDDNFDWYGQDADIRRICTGSNEGECFARILPRPGGTGTWLKEPFSVQTWRWRNDEPFHRMVSGDGNALQLQGLFRCREPASIGSCTPKLWIKTVSGPADAKSYSATIPADDRWHAILLDQDEWSGLPSVRDFSLEVNTHGESLDVDALWVSSDLVVG